MPTRTHFLINELLKKYSPRKNLTMIDYGCGSGDLLGVITPKKMNEYHGYDINKASLSVLHRYYPLAHIHTHHVDTTKRLNLGKTDGIDAVVSIGALQYMNPALVNQLLSEIHRVLKKKGVFIFSCTHDQPFYRMINLYGMVLPHRYFSTQEITDLLNGCDYDVKSIFVRGPILNPLFSYIISLFFDATDKVVFRTKGTLGPIGIMIRKILKPLLDWELNIDSRLGYTLFCVAQKE